MSFRAEKQPYDVNRDEGRGDLQQIERLRELAVAKAGEIEREIAALVYVLTVLFELVEAAEAPRAT